MLIGILSDSHGAYSMVRKAMELFSRLGVEHVVHCGDVGGISVLDEMVGIPCTFVWGNTDVPELISPAYLQAVGLKEPDEGPAMLNLGGKRIAIYHGHESGFARAPHKLPVDYIFHGHTHRAADSRVGMVRIINPGALYRAPKKTVATLELNNGELRFHELTGG